MFSRLWDFLVRWRTWLMNVAGAVLLALPDVLFLLHSPELMAVLPPGYQKWFGLARRIGNIWIRPRPAVRPNDAAAQK